MSLRYLFGPVPAGFADDTVAEARRAGHCVTFSAAAGADVTVGAGDTWESLGQRLPAGWVPDFVALYLPHAPVPAGLWSAPVPLLGLAAGWERRWHYYRHCLRRCDVLLADPAGAEALARAGLGHVLAAPAQEARAGARRADLESFWGWMREGRPDWLALRERARQRAADPPGPDVEFLIWQELSCDEPGETDLIRRLEALAGPRVPASALQNALGLAAASAARRAGQPAERVAGAAARHFQRALEGDRDHFVAALNLIEALLLLGQDRLALDGARRILPRLEQQSSLAPHVLEAGRFSPLSNSDRQEWERAAWAAAGRPEVEGRAKRDLLLARLQAILAERTSAAGLTSIVILCCDQLPYTRLCLESVLRHTRGAYELVLVDNGSKDGTAAYLEEVARRGEPARVAVITNPINRGYPAGCNQGLREARGEQVVLLHNDTVLTPGWLDGLLDALRRDGPAVGLVAPVTNNGAPPHQVPIDYSDLGGLDAFAGGQVRRHRGEGLTAQRLSGFCLLVRRAVLDKVGGLDEGYGLGLFQDDDLCLRARQAGFELRLARDVFVHHFGSRTFAGLGIDAVGLLHDNFQRFREKWGERHTAGYRLPPRSPAPARHPSSPRRPRVSLCMIVKDEEANLPGCLDSAAGLFDEVIVVDTGSTDRTREVAARFGARVFQFPWVDSFSAARNESLRHATGDWIFWMDADDRLDEDNRRRLRDLFATLGNEVAGYMVRCSCRTNATTTAAAYVDHVRLFRNHPQIRWRYRVHEQILPAVYEQGGRERWTDVVIHHLGYQDGPTRERKHHRNLRLLHMEQVERPNDPFVLFNIGWSYFELSRLPEGLLYLENSLRRSQPHQSITRKLYALLTRLHRRLGQPAEALEVCRKGRAVYPNDAELLYHEGLLLSERGDLPGAEACLTCLLEGQPESYFAIGIDAGLRGYQTRYNLGVIYRDQGKVDQAEAAWRAVLSERADHTAAWLGLAELWLAQERWGEVEEALGRLRADPERVVDAAVLQARLFAARRQFGEARRLLEETLASQPRSLWVRLVLSHVLLQEGRDWPAAERALRAVLELDPGHVQTLNNLKLLLQRERSAPLPGAAAP